MFDRGLMFMNAEAIDLCVVDGDLEEEGEFFLQSLGRSLKEAARRELDAWDRTNRTVLA